MKNQTEYKDYHEVKEGDPPLIDCFFAFSNEQFAKGIEEHNLQEQKKNKLLKRGIGGLYGTQEGISKFYAFYNEQSKRISTLCDPQQVYEYEFNNHECGYLHDDTEAMKLVISYFTEKQVKEVKRHNGCAVLGTEDILKEIIRDVKIIS